ncbi:MAG: DUF4446 family protein [Mobilitalea sp.]
MNVTELINENTDYIILGLALLSLVLLIFIIILSVKQSRLNKKYKKFMTGATGENLEDQVIARFADIDKLKADVKKINEEVIKVKENLLITYQKVGVVKYDAFKEMGGKLSFVMALLDKRNNGILLNSVHSSREGCYTYMKEIIKGESFLELSQDEKKALNQAISSSDFME